MSHSLAAGARFQSGGKLIPGCRHAGQSRANSPSLVPSILSHLSTYIEELR